MLRRTLAVVVAMVGTLAASAGYAQNAKNAMMVGDLAMLRATAAADGWSNIFSTSVKTSSPTDLQIGVSLEAGLFTDTLVRSKGGTTDTSMAEGMIEVRVLVDGKDAAPGTVIFARRAQTLMAKFGGILESCRDSNGDGTITADECLFTDEELQLILDTTNANSFSFGLPNVGVGTHQIDIQAKLTTNASWQTGSANAAATIGKGSVVVEEVKYINAK